MDELLNVLRKSVKSRISERRYLHTLGVEDMATKLGEHFIPEMISELRAAALLHDVAKELDYQEQIKIISDQGILVSPRNPERSVWVSSSAGRVKSIPQMCERILPHRR